MDVFGEDLKDAATEISLLYSGIHYDALKLFIPPSTSLRVLDVSSASSEAVVDGLSRLAQKWRLRRKYTNTHSLFLN
jgi:hypothetical protein